MDSLHVPLTGLLRIIYPLSFINISEIVHLKYEILLYELQWGAKFCRLLN